MKITYAPLLCLALPALALGVTGMVGTQQSPATRGEDPAVGATMRYKFKGPPLNCLGVKSLADLTGRPVLLANWGTKNPADDWVDDIVVWQKQYGSDLAVIMIETQGAVLEQVEAISLKKRWHNSRLMWSTERFVKRSAITLPNYVLLGVDGKIVMQGETGMAGMNFLSRRLEEIEDEIVEQIRVRAEGPEGVPKAVAGIWKQFAKGDIADAFAAARDLSKGPSGEGSDPVAAGARAARKFFRQRVVQRLARCAALLEEGRLTELESELEGLEGQLDGEPKLATRHAKIVASLGSDDNEAERAAAKALTKIALKIDKKGLNKAALRSLAKVAKKYDGTKTAARARHWIELAAKS